MIFMRLLFFEAGFAWLFPYKERRLVILKNLFLPFYGLVPPWPYLHRDALILFPPRLDSYQLICFFPANANPSKFIAVNQFHFMTAGS